MSTFAVETVAAAIRASSMRLLVGKARQSGSRRELGSCNVNVNLHLHCCQAVFYRPSRRKPMAKKTLEPQQARSRESTRKLLKAAAEVLGQHGVEGTTIPRIAQHAGLTPGAVYRRFPDKDALLEAVVMGILERQEHRLRIALTPDMARQIPLAVFAEQLVSSMLVSYRANAGLLRALRQFSQARFHTPFVK